MNKLLDKINQFYIFAQKSLSEETAKLQIQKDLQENGYTTNILSENEIKSWLTSIIPDLVYNKIICTKELKQCGHLSEYLAGLAAKNGITAGYVREHGHFVSIFPLKNGDALMVDPTHLQFQFTRGSLRDFSIEERNSDEYIKMKNLFDDLYKNPNKAILIEKIKLPNYIQPPQKISEFFNPILIKD